MDPEALLERVKELERARKLEEKDRVKQEAQRKKDILSCKKQVSKEVQLATKSLKKSELEATKVSRTLAKLETQAGQVVQKKARQVGQLDEQASKCNSKHQELETALAEKLANVSEARAKLAQAELTAKLLEMSADVSGVMSLAGTADVSLIDAGTAELTAMSLGNSFSAASGPQTARALNMGSAGLGELGDQELSFRSNLVHSDDGLAMENDRLRRDNQELRQRVEDLIQQCAGSAQTIPLSSRGSPTTTPIDFPLPTSMVIKAGSLGSVQPAGMRALEAAGLMQVPSSATSSHLGRIFRTSVPGTPRQATPVSIAFPAAVVSNVFYTSTASMSGVEAKSPPRTDSPLDQTPSSGKLHHTSSPTQSQVRRITPGAAGNFAEGTASSLFAQVAESARGAGEAGSARFSDALGSFHAAIDGIGQRLPAEGQGLRVARPSALVWRRSSAPMTLGTYTSVPQFTPTSPHIAKQATSSVSIATTAGSPPSLVTPQIVTRMVPVAPKFQSAVRPAPAPLDKTMDASPILVSAGGPPGSPLMRVQRLYQQPTSLQPPPAAPVEPTTAQAAALVAGLIPITAAQVNSASNFSI